MPLNVTVEITAAQALEALAERIERAAETEQAFADPRRLATLDGSKM